MATERVQELVDELAEVSEARKLINDHHDSIRREWLRLLKLICEGCEQQLIIG